MVRNYLLVALRSMRRQPGYAAVNVVGLALGVACCLLIAHFVRDEAGFDRGLPDGHRTYRLVTEGEFSGVGWPYGRILEAEYPEVERVTYLRSWPTLPIVHEGERLHERVRWADEAFFDVFPLPLVEGDARRALAAPFTVVLSEPLAARLFGDRPALGETVTFGDTLRMEVTGVARVPRQSHVRFDALLSMETYRALMGPEAFDDGMATGWLNINMFNYVRLREGADAAAFAGAVRDLPMERAPEPHRAMGAEVSLGLEPVRRVYLHSPLGNPLGPSGDAQTVRLLAGVGLLILLLAGVNFVNLATARSASRAKEVGVRKALGAGRGALARQALTESTLVALVAVALGAGLAALALPYFGELAARTYALGDLVGVPLAVALVALVLLVGGLAGGYPALVLARFRPVEALRGHVSSAPRGGWLRRGLVVFQFAAASALLVVTLIVLAQLRYMETRPLGFAAEQVLVLDAGQAPGFGQRLDGLRQALGAHTGVRGVAAAYALPGASGWQGQLSFPEGMAEGQSVALEYIPVDAGYVRALGLELVAGRDFDPARLADAEVAVVVNEAAVRAAGWASAEEAVGRRYTSPGSGKPEGEVIGVVRDYHHHGLRQRIEPVMLGLAEGGLLGTVAVRFDAARAHDVVAHAEAVWAEAFPGTPLAHRFLDAAFAAQYGEERRLARVFGTFAALAVLIACLGLLALAAHAAQARTKEVGVRKVLGASVGSLVALLSRESVALVTVAFVLAAPLAYWAMSRWLGGFAYRVEIGPGVFLAAGALALLAALVPVAGQAFRAATADPVRTLRSE